MPGNWKAVIDVCTVNFTVYCLPDEDARDRNDTIANVE